jgi:hypothetical protein
MSMYEQRNDFKAARHDLNQGDLLVDLLRPGIPTAASFHLREGPKATAAKPGQLGVLHTLRVMTQVTKLQWSIVVSNSCDIVQGEQVLLAPVEPAKLRAKNKQDMWLEISQLATSGGAPRRFYLPDHPEAKLERSQANLGDIFAVSTDYLDRCHAEVGLRRILGLSAEGVRHLRWALANLFTRNAREDLDWPSLADLELKLEWLRSKVSIGGPFRDEHEGELKTIERLLAKSGTNQQSPEAQQVTPPPAPERTGS